MTLPAATLLGSDLAASDDQPGAVAESDPSAEADCTATPIGQPAAEAPPAPARPPLDEQSRRKPKWREGAWITLADGNRWSFRRPIMEHVPIIGPDGTFVFSPGRLTLGREADAILGPIVEGGREVSYDDGLNLALAMLAKNYDLSMGDIRELLVYMPDDEENEAMWGSILDAALGVGMAPRAVPVPAPAPGDTPDQPSPPPHDGP